MHFPPVSDSPLFSKNCRGLQNLTFSWKISWFSSAEISDDLFSHRPQIFNFPPIFAVSVHFPLFRENYYFPLLWQIFPSVLHKFTCFLLTLRVFRFPRLLPWCIYALPNARTGRLCTGPRVIKFEYKEFTVKGQRWHTECRKCNKRRTKWTSQVLSQRKCH